MPIAEKVSVPVWAVALQDFTWSPGFEGPSSPSLLSQLQIKNFRGKCAAAGRRVATVVLWGFVLQLECAAISKRLS